MQVLQEGDIVSAAQNIIDETQVVETMQFTLNY